MMDMKKQAQLIYEAIDKQFDIVELALEGKTTKEAFMSGVSTALIIMNGLDTFQEQQKDETK